MEYVDLNNDPEGLEKLYQFLKDIGVSAVFEKPKDDLTLARVIGIFVDNEEYQIIWYKNECTLKLGLGARSPLYKFRYVYLDTTFPLVGGNKSIGFSYTKNEPKSPFDRLFPYESFRIPF